ncbi:MAG: hypothetical protein Q8O52_07655 [Sulfuritalea sp.]|nr:hypothetical protein [Sulfuritalea sp.]
MVYGAAAGPVCKPGRGRVPPNSRFGTHRRFIHKRSSRVPLEAEAPAYRADSVAELATWLRMNARAQWTWMMEILSNRAEIAARIRKEINAASTGTLIVRSSDGHIAMLGLEKGVLVSLFCEGLRGFKAIPRFIRIDGGTCQFDHLLPGRPQADLPAIAELLALLEYGDAAAHAVEIPEEIIACIAQALIEYLGPIAPMFCKSLVKTSGGLHGIADAERMIEKLAAEIDGDMQRRKFVADARRCLEKLG